MTQGTLNIKYESENTSSKTTSLAGLPLYLDLLASIGFRDVCGKIMSVRKNQQGWTDNEMIQALLLLNLAGGDCVDDMNVLEQDSGLETIINHVQFSGLDRRERRALKRRWRKKKKRTFPSPSSIFRYLLHFHDPVQDQYRVKGSSFVPEPTEPLRELFLLNAYLCRVIQKRNPSKTATLDIDATLIESFTKESFRCYKGFLAWQPVLVYWAEQDMIVHSEFRDGQVPAGHKLKRVLKESLRAVPRDVETVYLRSDSAGYTWELLKYMAEQKPWHDRPIYFTVSADVTQAMKDSIREVPCVDWKPLPLIINGKEVESSQEWTELCFVPSKSATSKNSPDYRYIAIREPMAEQLSLEEVPTPQLSLPFPNMEMPFKEGNRRYKITVIVTNRDLPAGELIRWHRKRCGKSEQVNGILKNDCAGGKMPTKWFGANAAWWFLAIMSFNVNTLMKRTVFQKSWHMKHLKAVRYYLIHRAGRVIFHARTLIIKVASSFNEFIIDARRKIGMLTPVNPFG